MSRRQTPASSVGRPLLFRIRGATGLALGLAAVFIIPACGPAPQPADGAASRKEVASPAAEFKLIAEKLFNSPNGILTRMPPNDARKAIRDAGPGATPTRLIQLRGNLVTALLNDGQTQEAVAEIEQVFAMAKTQPGVLQKEAQLHLLRGITYLRLAEISNCVDRHNGECCAFPLKGGGVHTDKAPAEQAAASFLNTLAITPNDLTTRWLLNIAHMAMGTYPDGVPKQFLIPDKCPNSSDDFPRFPNVAEQCGITRRNHAGGVVVEDLDNDGLLDIVMSSMAPDKCLVHYHNKGDGTFEDIANKSGLADQFGGLNLVATDYDNDGRVDLCVLRGGWLYDEGRIRKSLLHNNGDGTFTDVTRAAGIADPAFPTQVGVWFDYDNDGDLDLFVGNESRMDPNYHDDSPRADYPCNLFRNNGDGTFTDVAKQAGVTNDRFCKGAGAGDYDNDGWMDLYVSNVGRNRLYHNNKDGTFTDVAEKLGVIEPSGRSFATWFFDVDNDGWLDIFVGGYDSSVDDLVSWQLGKPFNSSPPRLYRNKRDGTFEDVTRSYELWRPMTPMGANFGDLDNDGWLDIYLATGAPPFTLLVPNVMLRNVGGKHFVDVTSAGGFGNLQKGHGVAFADLDGDGDQDIVNEIGGLFRGDDFFNSLYENPGNANHSLTLKLEGKRSNRLAYGARIKVVVKTPAGERAIHRAVGSVSSFGGSPSRQEIGLGDALSIESVEIWWPASGIRQTLKGLALDAFYVVTEGDDSPKKFTPKRVKLGGG